MSDSDPFECRLNFLSLLDKLNASQQSIHKVASYAVRHRKWAEDLYSCLLEELEKASIHARINIVYVLDAIFAISHKARFTGYSDLTRRDLGRIVEAVVPSDPKGTVNINNTRKILDNWRRRKYFEAEEIDRVEAPLLERESALQEEPAAATAANESGFSKHDIFRRMEEDRERHKRFREEIWIRSADEPADAEFNQLWDATDPLDPEKDYEAMMRQNMIRLPDYAWHTMLQHNPSDDAAAVERSNGGGDTAAS